MYDRIQRVHGMIIYKLLSQIRDIYDVKEYV